MATSFRLDEREQAKSFASYLHQLERRIADLERANPLTNASMDGGAIEVYDEEGSLQVVVGEQGDGTTGVIHVNGPPPPAPTAPVLAEARGGAAATWDGQFVDALSAPLDFSRVEVHASTAAEFEPTQTTQVGTIESPRGGVFLVPTESPVYVRFVARTLSGTAGEPSAVAGPMGPAKVVAQDVIDEIINENKLTSAAVTAAKIALGAVNNVHLAANSVTADKIVAGSVTAEKVAALAITTDKLAALSVTTDKIAVNSIDASHIRAGSIDATHIKAGSITADKLAANAIDGKIITGATLRTAASGGRIVLDASRLTAYGQGSQRIVLEPNSTSPYLYFTSDDGSNYAYLQVAGQGPSDASLVIHSGKFARDDETYRWRTWQGQDRWVAERVIDGTPIHSGGRISLTPERALISGPAVWANGVFRADNIAMGVVKIKPTPNVPTPVTLSGGAIAGTKFRAQLTANTGYPGTRVTGVGFTGLSSEGMTIWVTRTDSDETTVHWQIIGED